MVFEEGEKETWQTHVGEVRDALTEELFVRELELPGRQ